MFFLPPKKPGTATIVIYRTDIFSLHTNNSPIMKPLYRYVLTLSTALIAGVPSGFAASTPPGEPSTLAQTGTARQQKELEALNRRLAEEGERPDLELQRGLLLIQLGRDTEARVQFQTLRERYPEQPAPYVNLAALHVRAGELDQARQMLNMALERSPGKPSVLESLANIHLGLAWKYLKQATEGTPANKTDGRLQTIEAMLRNLGEAPSSPLSADRKTLSPTIPDDVSSPEGEVRQVIENWRQAWESRELSTYTQFYDNHFVAENKEQRDAWAARKGKIFSSTKKIKVKLKIRTVEITPDGIALVYFGQLYRAGKYRAKDEKVLSLTKSDGTWKILSERRLK